MMTTVVHLLIILKTTELYTLKGWTLWHVSYVNNKQNELDELKNNLLTFLPSMYSQHS